MRTVKELIALARANPGQLTTSSSGYGVFAPAGTPAAIVRIMHAEVNRAQDLPEVKGPMDQLGADDTRMSTPEAYAAMVKADLIRFAQVVKAAGIRIE